MSNNNIIRDFKKIWAEQCKKHELYCYLCGNPITSMHQCNAEHWQPKSKGGNTDEYNIKPSHQICNSAKGDLTPREWNSLKWDILEGYGITVSENYDSIQKAIDENQTDAIKSSKTVLDYRLFEPKRKKSKKIKMKNHRKHKQKKKEREDSYKVCKPKKQQLSPEFKELYSIGTTINYVAEDYTTKFPRFEIREGIVLGVSNKNSIPLVIIKDFFINDSNKIESELLEVIPLTKEQAVKIKEQQILKVAELMSKQR